jgi:hypothetical protein
MDQFPKVNTVSKAYADEVEEKWADKLKFLARQRAAKGKKA